MRLTDREGSLRPAPTRSIMCEPQRVGPVLTDRRGITYIHLARARSRNVRYLELFAMCMVRGPTVVRKGPPLPNREGVGSRGDGLLGLFVLSIIHHRGGDRTSTGSNTVALAESRTRFSYPLCTPRPRSTSYGDDTSSKHGLQFRQLPTTTTAILITIRIDISPRHQRHSLAARVAPSARRKEDTMRLVRRR